jgi:hypothetical protein
MKYLVAMIVLLSIVCLYGLVNYYMMRNVAMVQYEVLSKDHAIEIRQYPSIITAQVTVSATREDAIKEGFRELADFIFGNNLSVNHHPEKVAMTAPVLQTASEKIDMTTPVMQSSKSKGEWIIQFIMPEKYSLDTLPKPNNPRVIIQKEPAKKVVAIRFSGSKSEHALDLHLELLEQYIKDHDLHAKSTAQYAFYNPPWTLPFLRRNEILIEIQ